jgi:hypothetical protein
MSSFTKLLSIIPYPLFPTDSAGRKSILQFNNSLAGKIEAHAVNVKYDKAPKVAFNLIQLFDNSKLRYGNAGYVWSIKNIINSIRPQFLLIEHPYMAWMGVMLKQLTGIKWGIRSHNIEYARFKDFNKWWWPALKTYEHYVYAKADAVFFITEDDKEYAEKHGSTRQSFVMPTGMQIGALPADPEECKEQLRRKHNIAPDEKILIYNGALGYRPNREALDAVLQKINPLLEKNTSFKYKIIVCGSGLDQSYNNLRDYEAHNVIYAGFVDDITVYFKGADVYLNPVIGGGGIKTRLVEAIAFNTNVVSTQNGSVGFYKNTVEEKVAIVQDNDWQAFAAAVVDMCNKEKTNTTKEFYDYYFIDNITDRFIQQVNSIIS